MYLWVYGYILKFVKGSSQFSFYGVELPLKKMFTPIGVKKLRVDDENMKDVSNN